LVRYPVIIAWGRGCCQPLGCGLIGLSWVSRWDFGLTLTSWVMALGLSTKGAFCE
jgi:hypothetical protein